VAVNFIGGSNRSKPSTRRKLLNKCYHIMLHRVHNSQL